MSQIQSVWARSNRQLWSDTTPSTSSRRTPSSYAASPTPISGAPYAQARYLSSPASLSCTRSSSHTCRPPDSTSADPSRASLCSHSPQRTWTTWQATGSSSPQTPTSRRTSDPSTAVYSDRTFSDLTAPIGATSSSTALSRTLSCSSLLHASCACPTRTSRQSLKAEPLSMASPTQHR